tara:strand:- start:655 stop:1062 length:408 start_codon:yes stop_codon:yes gene_type:complete
MKKKPNSPRKLRWEAPFLSAYRESMNIRESCTAASITRSAYYKHLHTSGRFREAVEDAKADALDRVEAVALSRGLTGASDRLLEFWLKSHRPETYGDRIEVRDLRQRAKVLGDELGLDPAAIVKRAEQIARGESW